MENCERGCPKDPVEWAEVYAPNQVEAKKKALAEMEEYERTKHLRSKLDKANNLVYREFRLTMWLNIEKSVADLFDNDSLIDFVKYRLNFKHGTDDQVQVVEINVWPEWRRPMDRAREAVARSCEKESALHRLKVSLLKQNKKVSV